MNGKKAKDLRRIARERGRYLDHKTPKEEFDNTKHYDTQVTKKLKVVEDYKGKKSQITVDKVTIVNLHKVGYRRLKQQYKKGEITIETTEG